MMLMMHHHDGESLSLDSSMWWHANDIIVIWIAAYCYRLQPQLPPLLLIHVMMVMVRWPNKDDHQLIVHHPNSEQLAHVPPTRDVPHHDAAHCVVMIEDDTRLIYDEHAMAIVMMVMMLMMAAVEFVAAVAGDAYDFVGRCYCYLIHYHCFEVWLMVQYDAHVMVALMLQVLMRHVIVTWWWYAMMPFDDCHCCCSMIVAVPAVGQLHCHDRHHVTLTNRWWCYKRCETQPTLCERNERE